MGDMVSRWWWGGDPDEKNEISGMSLRDIHNVQRSWATINANPTGNGFLIFFSLRLGGRVRVVTDGWGAVDDYFGGIGVRPNESRLFAADPETKTFFKTLAQTDTEAEMATNVSFRAHVLNIMSSLDKSIKNLDKPELVVVWMEKLGDSHRIHRIEKKHFWVLKGVLVNILQNDLKLTDNVIVSWDRYVTFIYGHLLPRLAS